MTFPQPRSAPMCEQCAASTVTFPLCARNATRLRPRIRFESGLTKSLARQNKYHEAGWAGKQLTGGGTAELLACTTSCLMRLLMNETSPCINLADGRISLRGEQAFSPPGIIANLLCHSAPLDFRDDANGRGCQRCPQYGWHYQAGRHAGA